MGGQKIADPVVGVVDDGFEMELTPLYDPDGGIADRQREHRVQPRRAADPRAPRQDRRDGGDGAAAVGRSRRWTGEVKLEPGQDIFKITGLKHSSAVIGARPGRRGLVPRHARGRRRRRAATGEIVDRDEKNGNVFVAFPREAVPDDPWAKAPKEVSVYRGDEKIGTARLAGGWVLGVGPEAPRHRDLPARRGHSARRRLGEVGVDAVK